VELSGLLAAPPHLALAVVPGVPADTDLAQTMPLVWLMLIISVIGAAITWSFLAYAIWKYRDPATRGRRYG
jgi:hypothetical protein